MFFVFVLQHIFDLDFLAFVPAKALQRPWTLITSVFLHADIEHIFFNMFALFFFGTYLERCIAQREYIILFLVSGLFGNIGYMLTAPELTIPVVGASGSIYGIMGCLAALRPFAVIYIYFTPVPLILAAVIWAITEFLGIFTPSYIAHGSHLFGLVFGVLVGLYMKKHLSDFKRVIYM